jgi:hypothetical protein
MLIDLDNEELNNVWWNNKKIFSKNN